jgi:cytochrome b involved in lipid metabolism
MRTARFAAALAPVLIAATAAVAVAPATQAAPVKRYTKAQVAAHASAGNCWTIIGRSVYNMTPYVSRHPGGASRIAAICGRNGTSSFNGQHGGDGGVASTLAAYRIGRLR